LGCDDGLLREIFRSHTLTYQCHPPGFAAWSTPQWTVINGGERDRLDRVANAYHARGSQVLHTATGGAIHVAIREGRVAVDCWNDRPR
jgi:hypothetical protein